MAIDSNKRKMGKLTPKKELAVTIYKDLQAGMRVKDISRLFKVTKQRINYWKERKVTLIKKRKTKLSKIDKMKIVNWAKNKAIYQEGVSCRKLAEKWNKKHPDKVISFNTVNRYLNHYLSKPRKISKVFFLSKSQKENRYEFLKWMKRHSLSPENFLFTNESKFNLKYYLNSKNNKIRLS